MDDQEILRHIARQARQTAGYKQLVRELGVEGASARHQLAFRLKSMVRRGQLRESTRDHFSIPAAAGKGLVGGRLSMHREGYGFVTPDDPALRARLNGDIFISRHSTGAAMHGDRVLVELGAIGSNGRAEGSIAGVIARRHVTVVGIFHHGGRQHSVTPLDENLGREIVIPRGLETPPAEAAGPGQAGARAPAVHRVLGEEARRRQALSQERQHARHQREAAEALEGMVVEVEITDWPSATHGARGRVIEILGGEEDFGVDVEIVIRKHHLPHRFPAAVVEEAQAMAHTLPARELAARRDFRSQQIVTIDGETARDFDDAVAVLQLASGNYQLQVHIADVAHYVRPGSALDAEARRRGTSAYFPDRAVPMLPVELSTDLCSLLPQAERLVMSAVMEIDRQGEVVGYELGPGVIASAARMTYTDVNAILEGDALLRQRYQPLAAGFERMRELALILNRRRVRRGAIDFDLPEPVITFDEQGLMQGVSRSQRNVAHRIIEEFMLVANQCVAAHLEQRGAPAMYRIHEKPDAKKVCDFETIAAAFGYSLGVGALPIRRVQLRADRRARHHSGRNPREIEIPQEVRVTPRMYQKLTEKIAGKPEERILSYLMLRSLKQARYSEKNDGHFALAAEAYTHFTSPIRRYPDLIVHRLLQQALAAEAAAAGRQPQAPPSGRDLLSEAELREIAEHSSETERRAADAERELVEWKQMKFMEQRLGDEFRGLVVSVTKYGLFVELEELFIEGLVPLASLAGDRFTYRENTRQIIGERSRRIYSLGDRVQIIVDRIDHAQRKIQFALVEEQPGKRRRR